MKNIIYTFAFLLLSSTGIMSQCYPDRHSTNYFDSWHSCTPTQSPNPARGVSNWIQYELDMVMEIGQFNFWNYNHPVDNKDGIKDYIIDYSTDGTNWTEFGQFELAVSTGSSFNEGQTGPDMGDIPARYILITALTNHGGISCYGLSEIKVFVQEANVPLELVKFDLQCKAENTMLKWAVTNSLNQESMILERSQDAKNWEEIHSEIPKGFDQHEVYSFEYLDTKAAFGTNYYRLKLIDFDGTIEYSDVLQSDCKQADIKMKVYPVPALDFVNIELVTEEVGLLNYQVKDITGKKVLAGSHNIQDLQTRFQLDINILPVGSYTIVLNQNGTAIQEKIVKIKD